jgi:hypothetical protein
MKTFAAVVLATVWGCGLAIPVSASEALSQAREMEKRGDGKAAYLMLQRAVQTSPDDLTALSDYAEFLDLHRDPEARRVYEKLLIAARGTPQKAAPIARRLALLDLIAGDRAAAEKHLTMYREAGAGDLTLPVARTESRQQQTFIEIPGPLRSFARMSALSPELRPQELMGAIARNVVTSGYQASSGNESLEQTEYLKLVFRYMSQARELEKLAGPSKVIKIEACESTQTADLLRVLGFRMRGGCGSEVVLETVNATRAFLTMDSGFPLAELEQALRTNRPFTYDYSPTKAPILYTADYWQGSRDKQGGEFIDTFLGDPALCRLYLGFSKLDHETAEAMRKHMTAQRIRAFSHVLDFFGGMFKIRNGKAYVPGGQKAAAAWAELAGSSPDQGAAFYEKLLIRDDGWLAGYYDSIARLPDGPVLDYLTEASRLKRYYAALRGKVTSPGPARPVFRSNTDLMLLTARLRLEADGKPHLPGGLEVWRALFTNHPHGKYDGKLTKAAVGWKEGDDVIEALFALCRKAVENEPLKIYMALVDLDRRREKPLESATADRLAREFRTFGAQYSVFSEAPALSDKTLLQYLEVAKAIDDIGNLGVKSDAAGMMQSLVGLWQILARQRVIPPAEADATLSAILTACTGPEGNKGGLAIRDGRGLFDAGRNGLRILMKATGSAADANPQDRMIDLLAGVSDPADAASQQVMVADMIRVFEAQRLISLKTLFDLVDHLEAVAKGEKLNMALVNKLSTRISEVQLPRTALSTVEKNAMSFGYWSEKHVDEERKINIRAMVDKNGNNPEKLKEVRGLLAPILRDTLVGFNYIHYAPPGAQVLYTNPLFVRTHDFVGVQGTHQTWRSTEVFGSGWPSSAGGRLVGSLASLPYALAEAEQNFLIPSREQALIWGDLVPQLILSAKVPRWWTVTPSQTAWVATHIHYAETRLAEAALSGSTRDALMDVFDRYAAPARVYKVSEYLQDGDVRSALENTTPAELFLIGLELAGKGSPQEPEVAEARRLAQEVPNQVGIAAISEAFGTPKPTLANSYHPELLNMRTFPTLMGYSSRIMAESWESNTLYFAALSHDVAISPSQLNLLVPEWTQKTVEQIFATHLEDWPALLRSLRTVGDEVRAESRKLMAAEQKASL